MAKKRTLRERLDSDGVVCAEGYLFEMERRGYLTSGAFVPEVVLDNPRALRSLYADFQHAGSDVMEAFTYHGNREKMRVMGKEELLEPLNRNALRIAKEVADDVPEGAEPNLMAGNVCTSSVWLPDDKRGQADARSQFEETVGWSAEEGADYVIGETFFFAEEAFAALEAILASGLDAVVTLAPMSGEEMKDGWKVADACKELEQRGATVVGMNCFRGPATMMPLLKEIRKAVGCHVAGLPVTYRTTEEHQTFFNLPDNNGCTCPSPHGRPFPTAMDPLRTSRYEIRAFAEEAWGMGVRYLGVCCGASPIDIREVAEAMGRTPPASRYKEDMTRHVFYGSGERTLEGMKELGKSA